MKVYILEAGCYDASHIVGVFSSAEAAMESWQPKPRSEKDRVRGREYGQHAGTPWSYQWGKKQKDGSHHFGADWSDAASVYEYEVHNTGTRSDEA